MGKIKSEPGLFRLWPALVMVVCFSMGGLLGCLLSASVSGESAQQLEQYMCDYMLLAGAGGLSWSAASIFWNHGRWLLVCLVFGLTAFGVAGFPLLFGIRGFLLAFSIGCFVRFLDEAGLWASLLLFGVPALLWAPGFFLSGTIGLFSSGRHLRRRLGETNVLPISRHAVRSGVVVSAFLLIVCVVFECVFLPALLSWVAQILG